MHMHRPNKCFGASTDGVIRMKVVVVVVVWGAELMGCGITEDTNI